MSDSYALHLWDCVLERMPSGTRLDVEPFGTVAKPDIGYWRKSGCGEQVEQEDLAHAINERGCVVHRKAL